MMDSGIEEREPALLAQELFVHGLLRERAAAGRAAVVVRRPTWPRRVASVAAAALIVAALMLFVRGDALPTADAMVDRMERALAQPGDRHFVARVHVGDATTPVRTNHWYIRADRWTFRHEGPLGASWFGGDAQTVWRVGTRGRIFRWPAGTFLDIGREIDPSLPYVDMRRALLELRKNCVVSIVGRERGVVHVHARRRAGASGPQTVDFWAEEKSGAIRRGELRFESNVHMVELVDTLPQRDEFYTPEGHTP